MNLIRASIQQPVTVAVCVIVMIMAGLVAVAHPHSTYAQCREHDRLGHDDLGRRESG